MSMKKRMQGLGLVELMVALLIGSVLVGAAGQLLTVNQRTFALQEAVTGLMEDGQLVLRFISNDLRKAGYSGTNVASATQPAIVFDGPNPTTWNSTLEQLTISYQGTEDCQGSVSATPVQVINRYWVVSQGLRCQGSLSSAGGVELVSGVRAFNVEYGVDTTQDGDVGPFAFMRANHAKTAQDNGRPILAVRLTLLMERSSSSLPAVQHSARSLPWTTLTTSAATTIERLFHTTIMLRNMDWEAI